MDDDILSDVLSSVRLSGAIFFEVDVAAPWVAASPPSRKVAEIVMPDAQHVIEYHVLVEGTCWARLRMPDRGPPIRLSAGSIVAFPHGDTHLLASDPELDSEPDLASLDLAAHARLLPVPLAYGEGDGAESAHLLCGFLGCDLVPFNPLISALPRVMHVPGGYESGDGFLGQLIRATVREARARSAGSRGVLSKLSELIFIEAVRRYAVSTPHQGGGWLAGLCDPAVGKAIHLMHTESARHWTLSSLAREVGVSRSVLAERFTKLIGMPPMAYLANWRMQVAANMLADGASVSQAAVEAGYESEAAFSRAFKRSTGLPPAQWRKNGVVSARS